MEEGQGRVVLSLSVRERWEGKIFHEARGLAQTISVYIKKHIPNTGKINRAPF